MTPLPPDNERCEKQVSDGERWTTFHRCYKRAKGADQDGKRLCGLHLAALKRREEKWKRWEREQGQSKEAQRAAELLAEETGLDISPFYEHYRRSGGGYSDTHVLISIDDLHRLIEAYEKTPNKEDTE